MQRKCGITFLFRLLQQQQLLLVFSFVYIQLRKEEEEEERERGRACGNHNSLQNKIYIDLSLCACMSNLQANHLSKRKRENIRFLVIIDHH